MPGLAKHQQLCAEQYLMDWLTRAVSEPGRVRSPAVTCTIAALTVRSVSPGTATPAPLGGRVEGHYSGPGIGGCFCRPL